jgi:hypothetical protein
MVFRDAAEYRYIYNYSVIYGIILRIRLCWVISLKLLVLHPAHDENISRTASFADPLVK